ncbi:hypothetical protein PLICRDRAFT_170979 [Plicaturopsis crispa FD-325 SS-3]|nr:hypothetical protein PLICRDRAFT_170979 [Plicaturopsis crispa FD-325 SS-3]
MAPKRKSDVLEQPLAPPIAVLEEGAPTDAPAAKENVPVAKKARTSDASGDAATKPKPKGKGKAKDAAPAVPVKWTEVKLDGEDEDAVPVYDDCNEVRRKIRLLQKEPNWKVTHWLKEIGGINNNSYSRFMKETGPDGGASNGTYKAAYIYFEKVRIAEGKKKTAKRSRNEIEHPNGFPLEARRRYMWVGPA